MKRWWIGLAVVLVHARAPRRVVRPPLLGRPAEQPLDHRADVVPVAGADRGAVDDARQALDQVSISLLVQASVHLVMIVRIPDELEGRPAYPRTSSGVSSDGAETTASARASAASAGG